MSEPEHIQKQSLASELSQSEHNGFATRGFAEQIGQDIASKQPQDIKTQLSRAERFGHNLSKIPVPTIPLLAPLQTKVPASGGAVQRAEPEDDELQMKLASPAQLSTQSQFLQRKTSKGSVPKMKGGRALSLQHSTEPVRDSGFGSMLNEIGSIDNSSMDLNGYKSLNQHVESLLPKLQQQAMQQPVSGDTQSPMQFFLPMLAGAGKKAMGKK